MFILDQPATANSTHTQNLFQSSFLYSNSSFFWFISETKYDILDSPCVPILELNQEHKDEISASPKQLSLPQSTTTQPLTFKALQTIKITKLGLLCLSPHCFLPEGSLHQNWKANSYSLSGKRFPTTELEVGFANH